MKGLDTYSETEYNIKSTETKQKGSENMIFGYDPNETERKLKEIDPYEKVTVEVIVRWKKTGEIIPIKLTMNEKEYEIEKILDYRKGKSLKDQRPGYRYKCKVKGRICYLYYDEERWYLEVPMY